MTQQTRWWGLALAVCTLGFLSCSAEQDRDSALNGPPAPTGLETTRSLVDSWIGQPVGPVLAIEAAKALPSSSPVTVVGRVRRVDEAWALFELVDCRFLPCNAKHGDTCETPWDYCCEDQEEVAAGTLTVEFRDGSRPHRLRLRGQHGLRELCTITVSGTTEKDQAGNVIVVAERMAIK